MKIEINKEIKNLFFENTTVRQTIFKNTFWLFAGNIFNKLLGLLLLIYAARILGVTDYGKFSFALAFVSLFAVLHDFGLSTLITREYSGGKSQENKSEFYSVLSLKVILSIAVFLIILFSSFFITQDSQIRYVILILTLFSLFNGFNNIFYSFFQARQKMEYQALLETAQYFLMSGMGIFVLFYFPSLINLSHSYLIAGLISLIFVAIFFNQKIFNLKVLWQSHVWKKFLIMAWPLTLTGLFGIIYNYIDSVMMGYWGMITEVGWYNAAYRIIFVALLPAGLISGSFYPVLSKFFRESKERLQKTWDSQIEIMIMLALPLSIGGILLAPRIIYFLYPFSFSPAILAFQILILSVSLAFLYRPFSDLLIASNQQKLTFWITIFGAGTNIFLNFLLIPKYTLYGASVATVISYALIFLISILFVRRYSDIKISYTRFFLIFFISGISGLLMYFLIKTPAIYNSNVIISVSTGILAYFISFVALRKLINPIYKLI